MDIFIIHTKSTMLLSKKEYESWKDIQDQYPDYMASLGPWTSEETIEYLAREYPDLEPSASVQVQLLLKGSDEFKELKFAE